MHFRILKSIDFRGRLRFVSKFAEFTGCPLALLRPEHPDFRGRLRFMPKFLMRGVPKYVENMQHHQGVRFRALRSVDLDPVRIASQKWL